MKLDTHQRRAGLFVPVFALRTKEDLGIGDTAGLRQMVDWCQKMKFSVLQILPINETSDDNSPYNTISSLAIEPTTLEVSPETVPGLTSTDFKKFAKATVLKKLRSGAVQYAAVKKLKRELLESAFQRLSATKAKTDEKKELAAFIESEKAWLDEYAIFRALVDHYGHPNWEIWGKEHKTLDAARKWVDGLTDAKAKEFLKKVEFFKFVQWVAHRQWSSVKEEAGAKGVYLMGDIPFGVSRYSADVWARPNWFELKWSAGSPPETWFKDDPFVVKWGQNWGVPLYNWSEMEKDGYTWWQRRVRGVTKYFHLFRIDHVFGFYRIYAFPWQPQENKAYLNMTPEKVKAKLGQLPRFFPGRDDVAEEAHVNLVHGEMLLKMILSAADSATVIAEDLGVVPDYVRPSLERLGISGFKIPMFEREWDGEYKNPDQYPLLTVATLSTHDHETMLGFWDGWWKKFEEMGRLHKEGKLTKDFEDDATRMSWEIYRTQRFALLDDHTMMKEYEPKVREAICRRLMKSSSWLTVLMVTDLFGLKLRFNVPGVSGDGNWSARLPFTVDEMENAPDWEKIRFFAPWAIQEAHRAR